MNWQVMCGNNIDVLKTFPDDHFDSIVTDPPYGLTSITKRFGKEGSAPAKIEGTDHLLLKDLVKRDQRQQR